MVDEDFKPTASLTDGRRRAVDPFYRSDAVHEHYKTDCMQVATSAE
jgi:hypothetical protein